MLINLFVQLGRWVLNLPPSLKNVVQNAAAMSSSLSLLLTYYCPVQKKLLSFVKRIQRLPLWVVPSVIVKENKSQESKGGFLLIPSHTDFIGLSYEANAPVRLLFLFGSVTGRSRHLDELTSPPRV